MTKEMDALDARLRAALEAAQKASAEALDRFMAEAKLDAGGLVLDASGWAIVSLDEAERRVVNALRRVGAIRHGRLPVTITGFGPPRSHPAYQSLGAKYAACKAAASTLNGTLGDLARFGSQPISP